MTNEAHGQCHCDIRTDTRVKQFFVRSVSGNSECNDWVIIKVTTQKSSVDFICPSTEKQFQIDGIFHLRLTLYKNTASVSTDKSILPLKVVLDPSQPQLRVQCQADTSSSSSTSSTAAGFRPRELPSKVTTEPSPQQNSTALPSPRSEANYTLMVVGVVGLGVIAGCCIVCVVLCRVRRNRKNLSDTEHPGERFYQRVYRTTSNMFKSIMDKRPLPDLPKSLRRTKKDRLPPVAESGLYDSIRSQPAHAGEKAESKPEVTTQLSNDSSICYIHPVSNSHEIPITFIPGRSNGVLTDTYVNTVKLHENSKTEQNCAHSESTDNNMYIEPDKPDQPDSTYVYADVCGSRVCNLERDTFVDSKSGGYIAMNCNDAHCSESNKTTTLLGDTKGGNCSSHCDKTAVESVRKDDNTFPQLLGFEPMDENIHRDTSEIKEALKPKPKRYVRVLVDDKSSGTFTRVMD